jgi:hypothetical protein
VSHYGVGVMLPCDYVRDALLPEQAVNERHEWDQARKPPPWRELPPLGNAGADVPTEREDWIA